MSIALIAAMNARRVIGLNGDMPWHVSEDLKHFKALTSGHAVIMGRRTFLSIGRPLPKRRNLVISSTLAPAEGIELFPSLEAAAAACDPQEVSFIIGGARLYEAGLAIADTLYLTELEIDCEGDTFFPEFKHLGFKEITRTPWEISTPQGIPYSFVTYQRV